MDLEPGMELLRLYLDLSDDILDIPKMEKEFKILDVSHKCIKKK